MSRLFIAASIPQAVRSEIFIESAASIGKAFRDNSVRLIPENSLHLTLKFLGEVPETQTPGVAEAVEEACRPFSGRVILRTLQLELITPYVIALGIEDLTGGLSTLQSGIENSLERLGFPREARPFRPHITIARSRGRKRISLKATLQPIRQIGIAVESLALMRSELHRDGAVYTSLYEFQLG